MNPTTHAHGFDPANPLSTLAASFGQAADVYERGRPSYPAEAVEWLLPLGARHVVDLGAGTGKLTRVLLPRASQVTAVEPSEGMRAALEQAVPEARSLAGSAESMPLDDASVDAVFVAQAWHWVDPRAAVPEVARVLRPGGRWVFSVTHPVRWAFPDDPTERGLTAQRSYFDRRPYAERDESGTVTYAEYHRTLGDHVREITAAGLQLVDVVEPEWPEGHDQTWGGWSPTRGRLLPGTAIFSARTPG